MRKNLVGLLSQKRSAVAAAGAPDRARQPVVSSFQITTLYGTKPGGRPDTCSMGVFSDDQLAKPYHQTGSAMLNGP